jgi:hypothetical protein
MVFPTILITEQFGCLIFCSNVVILEVRTIASVIAMTNHCLLNHHDIDLPVCICWLTLMQFLSVSFFIYITLLDKFQLRIIIFHMLKQSVSDICYFFAVLFRQSSSTSASPNSPTGH